MTCITIILDFFLVLKCDLISQFNKFKDVILTLVSRTRRSSKHSFSTIF